ncbi:MAG: dephospho-CoA kinase [Acutalibacteraceae bacterium]
MTVWGLTGKSGSGKTTVAKLLCEKGFYVVDGDVLARKAVEKGSPVLKKLADFFGDDILLPDGTLDRRKTAERAFSTFENTKKLNEITHGEIDRLFSLEIEKAKKAGYENCIFDAAALLESPSKDRCDKIIVVTAPLEIRLKRILSRDSITEQEAMRRIKAQRDDEYYLSHADILIRNYPPFSLEDELSKIG